MLISASQELEELLNENLADCKEREKTTFDKLTNGNLNLVLFGAGGLGRKLLASLRQAGIEPLGFIDNKRGGESIDGLRVFTPVQGAALWGKSAIFVVSIWAAWADSMREQVESLHKLGCVTVTSFIPLLWRYPHLLPHVQVDLPSHVLEQQDEVRACFELWADDTSRQEFVAQIRWRLTGDFARLGPPLPNQYWQRDLIPVRTDIIFADAGAYNGDTLSEFIDFVDSRFDAAYLFEPDAANIEAIERRVHAMPENIRSRVTVFPYAVADRQFDVSFQGGLGPSSAPGSGSHTVHCVDLDMTLPLPPDIIKYDIEGFELLGIEGSRQIIRRNAPILMVCAYHLQSHLWEIPLLIHSIHPGYLFHLRPHGQIWETVCYAVPS